jgi:bacterioferritin (cytochrome b1)
MPDSEERLDEDKAIECLNAALRLQYRSALQYSLTAASLLGIEAQAIGAKLTGFGDEELSDCRRLIEKVVSFGGEPTTEVAALRYDRGAGEAITYLVECEAEAIDLHQESIEPTGREGRSEALEHLLEHLILRKQQQVDFLRRAAA